METSYICPFCRKLLIADKEAYFCYNMECSTNYVFYDDLNEEYETDILNFHLRVEIYIKNNNYFISIFNEDVTKYMKMVFNLQNLRLQGKTETQVSVLMKKIKKTYDMKAFW